MAAGLAAAVDQKFGLQADLIEGHDGIYEIRVNDVLVYTNMACEHPPVDEDVFAEISKHKAPLPAQNQIGSPVPDAPVCVWTPPATNQPT